MLLKSYSLLVLCLSVHLFFCCQEVRPFVRPWDTQGKRMGKEGQDGEGHPAHGLVRISA